MCISPFAQLIGSMILFLFLYYTVLFLVFFFLIFGLSWIRLFGSFEHVGIDMLATYLSEKVRCVGKFEF